MDVKGGQSHVRGGQRRRRDCSDGSMITDKTECESACKSVGATAHNKLQNGKPCYRNGQGKCRQNNLFGGGASLICKNGGNQIHAYTLFVFYFVSLNTNLILMAYLIIFIISVINNQSADMDMDVDPPAFTRLGTEHNLNNMDVTSEDGETLAMTRELRNTGGTYSLYLGVVMQCIKHF